MGRRGGPDRGATTGRSRVVVSTAGMSAEAAGGTPGRGGRPGGLGAEGDGTEGDGRRAPTGDAPGDAPRVASLLAGVDSAAGAGTDGRAGAVNGRLCPPEGAEAGGISGRDGSGARGAGGAVVGAGGAVVGAGDGSVGRNSVMRDGRSGCGAVSGGSSVSLIREVVRASSPASGGGEAGPGGRCASVLIRPPFLVHVYRRIASRGRPVRHRVCVTLRAGVRPAALRPGVRGDLPKTSLYPVVIPSGKLGP